MTAPTPPFDSLPLQPDGPKGNAWGFFGPKDELGMLNRLTKENTLKALKEATLGIRISTDWALDQPKLPCFNRQRFEHRIYNKIPRTVNDDILSLNTQSSSQWDGFRHFGYQDEKVYFNGCKQDDVHNSNRIVWVENGGIVGRGVLLDYASWVESQGKTVSTLDTTEISLSELKAVAKAQGVTFQPADILFIRSGFVKSLSGFSVQEAESYALDNPPKAIGIEAGEEVLRWIWENEFAAVAGDMLAFEALPFQSKTHWLHEWLLAGWGLPIGELFDLEKLALECRKHNKWSFFYSSVPLKVCSRLSDNWLANKNRFLAEWLVLRTVLQYSNRKDNNRRKS